MERNIVLTVFGLFSFGVVFIFGLTHSYDKSQSSVETKINAKAILPCPVLQEVVNKDGGYTYVQWYICASEGSSCDGEAPRWNWTAGMNEQGGQKSKRNGTSISSDGSLNITKVHLHDITKYMCRVSRINAKSPLVYYVTLTINENGTDQTTTDTVEISTIDPKTQDCEYTEALDNASDNTGKITIFIIVIVVLAMLLVVAQGYIMYLKDLVPRCCKRKVHSDTPVRLSSLPQT